MNPENWLYQKSVSWILSKTNREGALAPSFFCRLRISSLYIIFLEKGGDKDMEATIRLSLLGLIIFVQCVLFWEMGTKRKWMDKTIQVTKNFDNEMVIWVSLLFYLIQREFRLLADENDSGLVWSILGLLITTTGVRSGISTASKFIKEMEDRKTSVGITKGNTAYAKSVCKTYAYQMTVFILLIVFRVILRFFNSAS